MLFLLGFADFFSLEFEGSVSEVVRRDGLTVFSFVDLDFDVVVFGDEVLGVNVGDRISFSGRWDSYRGERQFVAKRIFLFSY